jgi:site-specific DNA-adenine methylase
MSERIFKRLVYADPPYLGCCRRYDHYHGDGTYPWDGGCWDDQQTHASLLAYLESFDGWAYSLSSPSLDDLPGLHGHTHHGYTAGGHALT